MYVCIGSDNGQCVAGGHGEVYRKRCQRSADQAADEDETHDCDRPLYVTALASYSSYVHTYMLC